MATEKADARIPVSRDTRRRLRQAKAVDGRTYDELLREEVLNEDEND